MSSMFHYCENLTVDCSGWEVSNVTSYDGFNEYYDQVSGQHQNNLNIIAPNWVVDVMSLAPGLYDEKYSLVVAFDRSSQFDSQNINLHSNARVLVIGDNTGSYQYSALENASNRFIYIEEIVFSEGVTAIGYQSFEGQTNLKKITLPSTMESLCWLTFNGDNNLTIVNYNGTIEQWNSIYVDPTWADNSGITSVKCLDGTIPIV